jgi:hypothetical protein
MRNMACLLCAFIILNFGSVDIYAQAPTSMVYQGRLINTAGDPITAISNVVFSIYADASGGTALWAETLSVAPNDQGIFTIQLGGAHPLSGAVFDGSVRFLGIKVGDDAEMIPRQFLASAPYAISAANIPDSVVTTAKIKDSSITQEKLAPGVTLPPSGNAGGSLSGSYPNPTIATGAVGTSQLADDAVTSAKIDNGAVTNSDLAGNAVTSGKIQDGTITSADLLNEAGLVFTKNASSNVNIPAAEGVIVVDSTSINVPDSGYVLVYAHATLVISHTTGTTSEIYFQISPTRAATISYNTGGFTWISLTSALPTSTQYKSSVDINKVFRVTAAGTYKFYVNCNRYYGDATSDTYWYPHMAALYVPAAHGTIYQSAPPSPEETLPAGVQE